MHYLARIGAQGGLAGPARAEFAFVDLKNGARWTLRPDEGRVALLDRSREPPRPGHQGE